MTEEKRPLILVVDDNADIRQLVKLHLMTRECDVIEADNGERGLERILVDGPDLVLLDVMMPMLNGWEVVKHVRTKPELDHIGVIMVTAIGETVNEMTSPLYGADDHINKPFQLSELDFKIRKVLSQKRRAQAADEDNTSEESSEQS